MQERKKKKKNSFCHKQYNIYTWTVKREKITMHICMSICMHRRMGTIFFLSKSPNIFSLPLAQQWFFEKKKKKKKGTQQLWLEVSSALKSTIFTCEWLKEKGNNAYTYVSIHVYTYTQMNEYYFITKHFFPLPFGSKGHSCKENGHYSYGWRCFLLCTMQYPHMNSEKRHVHT